MTLRQTNQGTLLASRRRILLIRDRVKDWMNLETMLLMMTSGCSCRTMSIPVGSIRHGTKSSSWLFYGRFDFYIIPWLSSWPALILPRWSRYVCYYSRISCSHRISQSICFSFQQHRYRCNSTFPSIIFKAKSIKVAESAKVIENIQRDLNISLVNELSIIFRKLGLNVYDILSAARTKWNFLDFKPGLAGGHCIGVDPYYLTYLSNCQS